MKLKVLRPFKDKLNHKTIYEANATLVTDDLKRINDLVARGLCEIMADEDNPKAPVVIAFAGRKFPISDVKDALAAAGVCISANAGEKGVTKVLDALTEEQTTTLTTALLDGTSTQVQSGTTSEEEMSNKLREE